MLICSFADKKVKWSITGGPFGSDLKSEHYTEEGVRIIQLQNLGDGKFLNENKVYTSEAKADELLACNIFPGELILSKMGDPVARTSMIPNFHERYLMGSDGIRLVPDKDKFDKIFVLLYLNYSIFRKIAIRHSTGSTRQRIGLVDLKKLPFVLPPLPEQQKIAAILSTWDKAIEKLEQLIIQKEARKKGLMQQLLTGKIRFAGFTDEWEEVKLKDISTKKSSNISANSLPESKGEHKIYGASGFLQYADFYREEDHYISIVKDGAGVGRTLLCDSYSSVLGTLDIIKPKNGVNLYFLYSILNQVYFEKYVIGSTIPHIYYKDYSNEKMKVPSLKEQEKIASILSKSDLEIEKLNKQLAIIKLKKKGLMQKLLTGEVRVKI